MASVITTILTFSFIAGLLLWFIIGIRGKPLLKGMLIVLILPCSVLIWNGFESYQGWPTSSDPPDKFLFLSGIAYKPDKQREYEGEIFIWLIDYADPAHNEKPSLITKIKSLFIYHPPFAPRAHKFPYSKELEQQVGEAMERQKQGIPTIVERNKKKGKKDNEDRNELGTEDVPDQEYIFYPLPPPKYPDKIREQNTM